MKELTWLSAAGKSSDKLSCFTSSSLRVGSCDVANSKVAGPSSTVQRDPSSNNTNNNNDSDIDDMNGRGRRQSLSAPESRALSRNISITDADHGDTQQRALEGRTGSANTAVLLGGAETAVEANSVEVLLLKAQAKNQLLETRCRHLLQSTSQLEGTSQEF